MSEENILCITDGSQRTRRVPQDDELTMTLSVLKRLYAALETMGFTRLGHRLLGLLQSYFYACILVVIFEWVISPLRQYLRIALGTILNLREKEANDPF